MQEDWQALLLPLWRLFNTTLFVPVDGGHLHLNTLKLDYSRIQKPHIKHHICEAGHRFKGQGVWEMKVASGLFCNS